MTLVQGSGLETLGAAAPNGLNPAMRRDPLGEAGTNIAPPAGEFPANLAAARFASQGEVIEGMGAHRSDIEKVVHWESPAVCYRALFFEEPNLERHGHKVPVVQPLLSAAHFFGTVPAIPYLAVSQKARQCTYSLGHYRPGSCAPFTWNLPRLSADASVFEAVTITGLILALP